MDKGGAGSRALDSTQELKDAGAKISTDGRRRWLDDVMIERLRRSRKHGCIQRLQPARAPLWAGRKNPGQGILGTGYPVSY